MDLTELFNVHFFGVIPYSTLDAGLLFEEFWTLNIQRIQAIFSAENSIETWFLAVMATIWASYASNNAWGRDICNLSDNNRDSQMAIVSVWSAAMIRKTEIKGTSEQKYNWIHVTCEGIATELCQTGRIII